jgi:hypothetical protein
MQPKLKEVVEMTLKERTADDERFEELKPLEQVHELEDLVEELEDKIDEAERERKHIN